jgi:hypothetical protein
MSSQYSPSTPEVNCDCHITTLAECCNIRVTQLTNGHTYHIYIQDKFGNVELQTGIAANGYIELDITNYPSSWLNQYAGDFILWAFDSLDLETEIMFTFDGVDYQCILLRFEHVNPIPSYDSIV